MKRSLVLFLVLLLFASCAPNAPADEQEPLLVTSTAEPVAALPVASPQTEPTVITFAAQEWALVYYRPLVEAFNAANGDIQVHIVRLGDSMDDADAEMRRAVTAADTAFVTYITRENIAKGYVRDMTAFVDADPSFKRDDFYPGVLERYDARQGIYHIPSFVSVPILNYNKQLWQSAGLPAPALDWSWSDLLLAAEQLAGIAASDDAGTYGAMLDMLGETALFGALSETAPDVFSAQASVAALDQPNVVTVFEQMVQRWQSRAIYAALEQSGSSMTFDTTSALIREGRVGIWTPAVARTRPDAPPFPFDVGTALLPNLPGTYYEHLPGYVMSAGTQHPEAAWRWLSFLSRQVVDPFNNEPHLLPARKSVAQQLGYWEKLDGEATAAFQTAIARFEPKMGLYEYPVYNALMEARDAIVVDQQTPARAIARAITNHGQNVELTQGVTPVPIVVATPRPQQARARTTTITFDAVDMSKEQLRALADSFAQQAAVTVEIPDTAFDTQLRFADVAGRTDCFAWPNPPDKEEALAALDLQPLLDADAQFPRADYPPVLLALLQSDGRLRGLPYEVKLRMLAYDQQLFDAAGLTYPSSDWKVGDFAQAAQTLTIGEKATKQYGFAAATAQTNDLLYWLRLAGAQITVERQGEVVPNFLDETLRVAAASYVDILRQSSPEARLLGYTQAPMPNADLELIEARRVAMWLTHALNDAGVVNRPRSTFRLTPAPMPSGPVHYADVLDSEVVVREIFDEQLDLFWFFRAVDRALQGGNLERELSDAQFLTEQYGACVRGGEEAEACAKTVDPQYNGHLREQ